ncbi:MAG TPA: TIM-barrel domain-containing protein [Candidatus Binataceae bacterium]|nr:TIM-barrel domain-containing protein [Candidatus Binataceae bacterium]
MQATLGRLKRVTSDGNEVVFGFDSSELILTPVLPTALRHTWLPGHWRLYTQPPSEQGCAVAQRRWPGAPQVAVREQAELVEVRAGEFLIEARRDPFRLRYLNLDGQPLLEEAEPGGLSWSYWEYTLSYQLATEEHFYGMGQPSQLDARVDLDHRGHRREIWNRHSPPAECIFPLLFSSRGYGLLIDNPHRACWDLGHENPATFAYQARGGPLEYYVFGGDLKRLAHTYLKLTGRPPMPPRWLFGLLQSRYSYRSRGELEAVANEFRARALPCDGLILDLGWFKEMGDLAFDETRWPAPAAMLAGLAERGFRVMAIEEPYVTLTSPTFKEAEAGGHLTRHYDGRPYVLDFWPGRCGLVDFTNPATRQWWSDKHRAPIEMGIASWWSDLNEPSKHLQDMCHFGGSAAAVHNSFALRMHEAIAGAQRRYAPGRRGFILSRAAFPGSQRHGVGWWSGDVDRTFAALRKQVAVGLSAGMAGMAFWGSDIGGYGFAGQCTPELYVRWFQFGAFCPLFRPHGDEHEAREPWRFGSEIEAICRRYLRVRYRLMPYIYSAARQACTRGLPIMRPLVMEFPDDSTTFNLADQFLFGPDLLVAPVLDEGARERTLYLPVGDWFDFWSNQRWTGPRTLSVPAPLDHLPLFVRQGAIIPLGPEMQFSSQRPLDPLRLEIYPGLTGRLDLYEDDGESTAYESAAWVETKIAQDRSEDAVTLRIGSPDGDCNGYPAHRLLRINLRHAQPPRLLSCQGSPLAPVDAGALAAGKLGYFWDAPAQVLRIQLQPGRSQLDLLVT